jgi:D-2-hydroxyacid dehydrogenase (NADP+)
MNIILLQSQLTMQEMNQLLKEFPQYLFLSLSEAAYKNLSTEQWSHIEIIYGSRFTEEELARADQLHWIHCPGPYLNRLCMDKIEKQGNILVSNTIDENISQMGEFALSGILAFAKNLFAWKEVGKFPALVWDSKWRDSMWTLNRKTLLQIGLGKVGTEITKRAREMGMKVWGMQQNRSFHRYCHRVFSPAKLHEILPLADVVSLCLPRGKEFHHWLRQEEFELMKEDSILISLGSSTLFDEDALFKTAEAGKFRGILLDAFYGMPISVNSPVWKIPQLLVTPDVSQRPKSEERIAFRIFLYNLRQYVHGNFKDMRNIIEKTAATIPETVYESI